MRNSRRVGGSLVKYAEKKCGGEVRKAGPGFIATKTIQGSWCKSIVAIGDGYRFACQQAKTFIFRTSGSVGNGTEGTSCGDRIRDWSPAAVPEELGDGSGISDAQYLDN